MENIFKEQSKCVKIYLGTETETDPYEHTIEETLLNPISIKAIITDLTTAKIQWAMPGIISDKAKEIIIRKKDRPKLEASRKLKIGSEYFEGWKVNGMMQIREEGNFCRCYIYIKKS